MAHWIAKVIEPTEKVFVGDTKDEVIQQALTSLTNRSRYPISSIAQQLRRTGDKVSIATDSDNKELAKVFNCNCGSKKRHG